MPRYATSFGRGLLVGAGAVLLYTVAREAGAAQRAWRRLPALPDDTSGDALLDWNWATRAAILASGAAPMLHPSARQALTEDYRDLVRSIEGPLSAYTGNQLSLADIDVQAVDRAGWIRANMGNFREVLHPIETFYREVSQQGSTVPGLMGMGGPAATRLLVGSEMGMLVGYLSRRVLGQYDLTLLGDPPPERGRLFFVDTNLRGLAATLNVSVDDFRCWVALHEATHAHEFEIYPWVRQFLNDSTRQYLRLVVDDLRSHSGESPVLTLVARLIQNVRQGHGLLASFMNPEQRALLQSLQAFMSLAEGYSNHVMNAVGRQILPQFGDLHERVERRAVQRRPFEATFLKLTGLSLKMEQYKVGEKFVDHVVAARGITFANQAWEAPENLPTLAELSAPDTWIARLDGRAA